MPIQSLLTTDAVAVESSALAQVAYDREHQTLRVEFRDGSIYEYEPISVHIYRDLLSASSKGAFFNRNIRSRFPRRTLR